MGDDARRDAEGGSGRERGVFEADGDGVRLAQIVDAQGRVTRYSYDDAAGIVEVRSPDGSRAVLAIAAGQALALARNPETGTWTHVCVPARLAPAGRGAAWPARLLGVPADEARAARKVARFPAPTCPPGTHIPGSARVVTYTYDMGGNLTGSSD